MVFVVLEEVILRKIDQQYDGLSHINFLFLFFLAFWVLLLLKDIDGNVDFPLGDVW